MLSLPPSHNLASSAAPIKSAATMEREFLVIFKSLPSPSAPGGNTYDMGGMGAPFGMFIIPPICLSPRLNTR